jgi:hypothetical protein
LLFLFGTLLYPLHCLYYFDSGRREKGKKGKKEKRENGKKGKK